MSLDLTQDDTAPDITGITSAALTGATVVAHIKRPDKTVFNKTPTITDAATGAWSISWAGAVVGPPAVRGDLDATGTYYVEIQATFSNGKIQTFRRTTTGQKVQFTVGAQIA